MTERQQPILIENIERLRESFRRCLSRHLFEIEAIVILPDHLHSVWRLPEIDAGFSKRWMVIKRHFSTGLPIGIVNHSKVKKRQKDVWQRRFWEHQIRDDEDWRRHIDYVHFNPVKHNYVEAPQNWSYSSYDQAVHKGWYETHELKAVSLKHIEP